LARFLVSSGTIAVSAKSGGGYFSREGVKIPEELMPQSAVSRLGYPAPKIKQP
jgi:hypothetical protein